MEHYADLQEAFERTISAFNARNLDNLAASVHDQVVQAGALSPVPLEGKTALREHYRKFFMNYENSSFTPINPHFCVSGSTGTSWGHFALTLKPEGAAMTIPVGCYTMTFTKDEGKWLVIAAHFSWLPQCN
jgi:hypothetical protein